jgi:hypothetical protein
MSERIDGVANRIAKIVVAESKGTIDTAGNAIVVRKLFGTNSMSGIIAESRLFRDSFIGDLTDVIHSFGNVNVKAGEVGVGGMSQGAYFELYVKIDQRDKYWDVLEAMGKKGYRIKR